jgi:hypothetical protein
VSELDASETIEREAIEGGFLVAITQFTKLEPGDDINIISFESQDSGTFLVARSQNFIASLLWTEDLDVSIEQSKIALKDMLEHLEATCETPDDTDKVAFYVSQYISNMM